MLLAGVLLLSLAQLVHLRRELAGAQRAFELLAAGIPAAACSDARNPEAATEPTEPPHALPPEEAAPEPSPENRERFAGLLGQNGDFAGWLTVDGTRIDYPVMLSSEPDYYLTHGFAGEESPTGTPFIGENCDTKSDNIIIYAHNMKNGTMFADLLRYQDAAFFAAHPTVRFDTVEHSGEYEIIAVFREKVHYRDEQGVFRYYDYAGALTEEQFATYIGQIRALSLYDTERDAVYGRQLITLSTCAYHT